AAPAVRERVQMPAIFLIVVGALNLLGGGFSAFMGLRAGQVPAAEIEREMQRRNPGQWEEAKKEGYTAEGVLSWMRYGGWGLGASEGALFPLAGARGWLGCVVPGRCG